MLWLLLAGAAPAGATGGGGVLYIQPLGEALPSAEVELVRRALRTFTGLRVEVLPRRQLPQSAFYPPRRRYRAEKLLDLLESLRPADGHRILGLTKVDISTRKGRIPDWGVLGLANLDGGACVISSFRCKRGARDRLQARERLAKVAVHEIGHTLGLEHCPVRGCLMEDARGKVSTCDGERDLCPQCRLRLKQLGRPLPAHPDIPWSH